MQDTSDQFSDKFNNDWKKSEWLIYCDFSHFTSIIWPCWCDNLNSFSFILLKFVMYGTNKQFSDNFDSSLKKMLMAALLWFFAFYFSDLTCGFCFRNRPSISRKPTAELFSYCMDTHLLRGCRCAFWVYDIWVHFWPSTLWPLLTLINDGWTVLLWVFGTNTGWMSHVCCDILT